MSIKLAIPSKGRLMDKTFDWFAKHGISLSKSGADREYAGRVEGVENIDLVLLSASEIPRELASGRVHLGVTGDDLVQEKLPLWQEQLEAVKPMGFGQADLIIAVPDAWKDVRDLHDLDEVCAQFRARHGKRLRIATKYHRLVREYLFAAGVANYALVDSQGATEGTVANGTAEAIADITSTGETLRANHLRPLSDALVLASQATLWRSQTAPLSDQNRVILQTFMQKIEPS